MSKDFADFVKGIGETRSKDEEQEIMRNEVTKLRMACQKPEYTTLHVKRSDKAGNSLFMSQADENARRQCELLVRLIYCEMLGFEVPFGYMAALNCTQHSRPDVQRAGYLALTLFLNGEHELTLLATNSLMKSLSSPDVREVCSALTAVCKLVTARTVPVFYDAVRKLATGHERSLVRKKAVMALHAMVLSRPAPEAVAGWESTLRETLCDKDPCVMSATLAAIYDILEKGVCGAGRWGDIVQPLGSILSQIISRKLPRACDYNGMPAPWVQVRIIDLLGLLGAGNAAASAKMYEPLGAALRAALGFRLSVSSMVIYSVVKAATRIVPDKTLLGLAAAQIGAFLRSGQPNLRYLGIRAMGAALRGGGETFAGVFAAKPQFQMAVVECLESHDDTLRHETLDILYHMTSPANAQAIAARMLDALRRAVGEAGSEHLRRELVAKIAMIVSAYAPSPRWALETLCAVMEIGRDICDESVAEALLRTLDPRDPSSSSSSSTNISGGIDPEYARFAVDWFVAKTAESLAPGARGMPTVLARAAVFVLGEHGHLAQCGSPAVVQHLLALAEKFHDAPDVLAPLIGALAKLCARAKDAPQPVLALLDRLKSSASIDLQQRAYEHSAVLANLASAHILVTAQRHTVDPALPFLASFVAAAVAKGAKPYRQAAAAAASGLEGLSAAELLQIDSHPASQAGPATDLNVAAYPTPQRGPAETTDLRTTPYDVSESSAVPDVLLSDPEVAAAASKPSIASLSASKKSKWSLSGYNANPSAQPQPAAATTAATATATTVTTTFSSTPATASPTPQRHKQSAPAVATPKHKMSAEEQRKARIAKDLFGFSGTSTASATPKKASTATAAATPAKPAATHSASADLLGLDIGISSAPTTTTSTASSSPAKPVSGGDLLDLLGGVSSSSSSVTSAPAAKPIGSSSSTSGADLLGLGLAAAPAASTSTGSLLGSGLTGSSPFNTGTYSHPGVIHISNVPGSAFMTREVLPYLPNANTNATLVGSSGAVGLYYVPLMLKDGYGIALIASNESEGELPYTNTVQITLPGQGAALLSLDVVAAPGVQSQGAGKLALQTVPPKCSPVCVCRLEMRQTGLQQPTVTVQAAINSGAGNIGVTMKDFLREPKLTTKEVGAMWQKHNQEKKVAIKASDIRSAVSKIVSTLHAHCADIINDEAILVVQVASKTHPYCLIHCRFSKASQQATVAVRTESPFLTDAIARSLN